MKLTVDKNGGEYLLETEIEASDGDEEILWVKREGFGPVAIFPSGDVLVWSANGTDDPVEVRADGAVNP